MVNTPPPQRCIFIDITGHHAFTPAGRLITHEISADGQSWLPLPPALAAGPEPYDDGTITAAAVACAAGGYWLFYVATDSSGRQRILLANSADLIRWDKYPQNPVVHALPTHMRSSAIRQTNIAFMSGLWHLTLTADAPTNECRIAVYTSPDLLSWTLVSTK
jgi:sucrose-6-phosphate hydrolase SacC (GH32 family)